MAKGRKKDGDVFMRAHPAFFSEDEDKPQKPMRVRHGTWCRTRKFRGASGIETEYMEAYLQPGSKTKWTVNRVNVKQKGEDELLSSRPVQKDLSFQDALKFLAAFETSQVKLYGAPKDEAEEPAALGERHYVTFAEREGVVFDKNGVPHMPDHEFAVPEGDFNKLDLDRAAKARAEAADLPRPDPDALLSELFNAVSHRGNFEEVMSGLAQIGVMDEFVEKFGVYKKYMERMLADDPYRETEYMSSPPMAQAPLRKREWPELERFSGEGMFHGHIPAFYMAVTALDEANELLSKVQKKNIKATRELKSFLLKCELSATLIRARQLFDRANTSDKGNEDLVKRVKYLEEKAEEIYVDLIGSKTISPESAEKLKQAVLQGTKGNRMPEFVRNFDKSYKALRKKLEKQVRDGKLDEKALRSALADLKKSL